METKISYKMGIILNIIAQILFLIVGIVQFFVIIVKGFKKRAFLRNLNNSNFKDAFNLDVYSNYKYQITWNALFRVSGGYSFGKEGETISGALGKNQLNKTLSWFGWIIVIILYIVDYKFWGKGGHCLNSIQKYYGKL